MFADAYEIASSFTQPIIISNRLYNEELVCSLGSFVIVNPEGWVVTVAHLFDSHLAVKQSENEIAAYEQQKQTVEEAKGFRHFFQKDKEKASRLQLNPQWVTNCSTWCLEDGVNLENIQLSKELDLAVAKLQPFDPKWVTTYPTFKRPYNLRPGTSLCRLGYPFHGFEVTYNKEKNSFIIPPSTFPIPRFPIEGIYTRDILGGKTPDEKYEIKFLETSSPGLKGQSGGSIFDVRGTVWSIQSHTRHYNLGFHPEIVKDGQIVEENQFLNIGYGIHPEILVTFLTDNGINFNMSDY